MVEAGKERKEEKKRGREKRRNVKYLHVLQYYSIYMCTWRRCKNSPFFLSCFLFLLIPTKSSCSPHVAWGGGEHTVKFREFLISLTVSRSKNVLVVEGNMGCYSNSSTHQDHRGDDNHACVGGISPGGGGGCLVKAS